MHFKRFFSHDTESVAVLLHVLICHKLSRNMAGCFLEILLGFLINSQFANWGVVLMSYGGFLNVILFFPSTEP